MIKRTRLLEALRIPSSKPSLRGLLALFAVQHAGDRLRPHEMRCLESVFTAVNFPRGRDDDYGWGVVDATAAAQLLAPERMPPPGPRRRAAGGR